MGSIHLIALFLLLYIFSCTVVCLCNNIFHGFNENLNNPLFLLIKNILILIIDII